MFPAVVGVPIQRTPVVRIPVQRIPVRRVHITQERIPVVRRVSVTKETLAVNVAKNEPCSRINCNCARFDSNHLLYESIIRLIYKHANSYKINSCDAFEDLVQDCIVAIWTRLSYFKPERGSLSTWVWHVCKSVLNNNYCKSKRTKSKFVQNHNEELYNNVGYDSEPFELRQQILEVVKNLHKRYPERRSVLLEMFGDLELNQYALPQKVCIQKIADNLNMQYMDVWWFYRRQVTPFFKKSFGRI